VGWRVHPWQWRQARSAGRWLRVHGRRPGGATTGAITHRAAMPPSGARRWESSGWHLSYLPVVRCARVGLLPSRSGRIAMYAAAINRPSPTTPSPEGAHRFCADGVVACQLGRCLQARPRRWPSPSGPPSSPMPFSNRHPVRPAAGQPCRQQVIVIARGDRRREKEPKGVMRLGCLRRPPGGVPGPWQWARRVRLSAGRPGVRPIKPKTVPRSGWRPWLTG
jgi:hypothetical protein